MSEAGRCGAQYERLVLEARRHAPFVSLDLFWCKECCGEGKDRIPLSKRPSAILADGSAKLPLHFLFCFSYYVLGIESVVSQHP